MCVENFLSNDLKNIMFDLAYSTCEKQERNLSFYEYICEQIIARIPEVDGFYYDKYFEDVVVDVRTDIEEKKYSEIASKIEKIFWEVFDDKDGFSKWKRKRIEEMIIEKVKELSTKSLLLEGLHIIEEIVKMAKFL